MSMFGYEDVGTDHDADLVDNYSFAHSPEGLLAVLSSENLY